MENLTLSQPALCWLQQTFGVIASVTPILHSHTNLCFKVSTSQCENVFVKQLNTAILSPQSQMNEQAARHWIQTHNATLTPTTLAENNELGLIVDTFIYSNDNLSRLDKIYLLAEAMANLHKLTPPDTSQILAQQIFTDLADLLNQLQVDINQHANTLTLAKQLDQNNPKTCLCHGDLSFANLIFSEQSYLIDWEYARLGEPAYDLAASILINQLNITEQKRLLDYYCEFSSADLNTITQRTSLYLKVLKPLNQLWFQHKHQLQ